MDVENAACDMLSIYDPSVGSLQGLHDKEVGLPVKRKMSSFLVPGM